MVGCVYGPVKQEIQQEWLVKFNISILVYTHPLCPDLIWMINDLKEQEHRSNIQIENLLAAASSSLPLGKNY